MSDGLRRAALEALCSRGPWSAAEGNRDCTLTGAAVRAVYNAVPDGPDGPDAICGVLGVDKLSRRRADRALQLLRRAGLIYYDRAARVWRHGSGKP